MTGIADDWNLYTRWNRSVADVVYATSNAGQPVYLDLEEEVLGAIRDAAEPDATNATIGLVRAVRNVLQLDGGPTAVLRALLDRLARWEKGDIEEPPPTLALLAVLSLAAENMRYGEGKAAHNFYGRLAELLSLDEKQCTDFIAAYRKVVSGRASSEVLWDSLNIWLELLEGNRGLVTVYADRHAHVSLPMSQALVREVDRDKFRNMFALYGLAPRSSLPAAEMVEVIDDWVSHLPCPASNQLERLWKRDADAKERITDVARLTLESWDGSGAKVTATSTHPIDHVRVRAKVRAFPRLALDLSLVLPAPSTLEIESLTVLGEGDAELGEVDVVPVASGWVGLGDGQQIDAGSFLRGETKLRWGAGSAVLRRRPRRVVPLRHDDLLNAHLECDRVSLGDDFLLVIHSDVALRWRRPSLTPLDLATNATTS